MFLMILLPLAMTLPHYDHYSGANSSHHLSKRNANGGINCGGHRADTCHQCSITDPTWCNSDCKWQNGACTFKDISGFQKEVLHATNVYRKSQGKKPLDLSNSLSSRAQNWADTMKSKCLWEHTPWNQRPYGWSENLYMEYGKATVGTSPIDSWIESPGHNKNMLGDWTVMGVGLALAQNCNNFYSGQKTSLVVAQYM